MLKRRNKKCDNDEVFKLVKDSLGEEIAREIFEELLESLVQRQSIKLNIVGKKPKYLGKSTKRKKGRVRKP